MRGFLTYSAQGLVEMLREQIDRVQQAQRNIAWVNYVHQTMATTVDGPTQSRQRALALSMPTDRGLRRTEVRRLTAELAEMYATKTDKTLTRDVNKLVELGLIRRDGPLLWSRIDLMDAFLPVTRQSG
ncbi:MAG: hypothetical protein M3Z25_07825 [Actinomycetota bacterium]|nr:hypothetical protein [Actinomycetota bacterium]